MKQIQIIMAAALIACSSAHAAQLASSHVKDAWMVKVAWDLLEAAIENLDETQARLIINDNKFDINKRSMLDDTTLMQRWVQKALNSNNEAHLKQIQLLRRLGASTLFFTETEIDQVSVKEAPESPMRDKILKCIKLENIRQELQYNLNETAYYGRLGNVMEAIKLGCDINGVNGNPYFKYAVYPFPTNFNWDNSTPLMAAIIGLKVSAIKGLGGEYRRSVYNDVIDMLLKAGARTDLKNDGETAQDIAQRFGIQSIVTKLKAHDEQSECLAKEQAESKMAAQAEQASSSN